MTAGGGLDPVAAFAPPGPRRAEAAQTGASDGELRGVTVAVKDVIDVAGMPTALGVAGYEPPPAAADAAVVAALRRAGAELVGKAQTHELALGVITPQTANPLDRTRIAGGSSGGSAAAIAAGFVEAALGTDSSGSSRCPASLCGVVGLKPTYGLLPRAGVAPLAPSQDVVGVLAADVELCARTLAALTAGAVGPRIPPAGARLGIDRELIESRSEPAVAAAVLGAAEALAAAGAELVELELGGIALADAASTVIVFAEAAAEWGGRGAAGPPFSAELRGALAAGARIPAGDYVRAGAARAALRQRQRDAFAAHALDAILLPTTAVTAPLAGAATVDLNGREVPVAAALTRFLSLASLTGQPALSVPCGLGAGGLPVGLQLLGRPYGEPELLRLAAAVEVSPGAEAAKRRREESQGHNSRQWLYDISCTR